MAEYIKRTDAMKICQDYSSHCFISNDASGQDIADRIEDDIAAIPTAEVGEVKHGRWIEDIKDIIPLNGTMGMKTIVGYRCSLCNRAEFLREPYCNCGAKMDGKELTYAKSNKLRKVTYSSKKKPVTSINKI